MFEHLGEKYYEIFTINDRNPEYTDPVTREIIAIVAKVYNVLFHEAPLWVGHPLDDDGQILSANKEEPEALAWIKSLIAIDNTLYASFSSVNDEAKYLSESKRFKYLSAEFVKYLIDGVPTPYLFAIGFTNRPGCKGLEPILFTEIKKHKFNKEYNERITFSEISNFNFINQTQNQMNQYLTNAAKTAGVEIKPDATEDQISTAIIAKFTEMKNKIAGLETKITELNNSHTAGSDNIKQFTDELNKLKTERNLALVESAISAGKVLPAQKDGLLVFADKSYEDCKKYIDALPVSKVFDGKTIKPGQENITSAQIDFTEQKFINPKSQMPYTYAEVIKDNAIMKNFTDDELLALKAKG